MIVNQKLKKTIVEVLSSSFLFKGLSEDILKEITEKADISDFNNGDIIIDNNQFQSRLAILIQGKISVKRNDTLLNQLEKGDVFGAASLFGGEKEKYFTVVEAVTKAKILFLSQKTVEELIEQYSIIAKNYIIFLSEKIRFLNKKIDSFTSDNGMAKTAKALLSYKTDSFTLPQSISKLSDSLSMGRATLYRSLDNLEENGIIRRENKNILILNREKLKSLAD